MHEDLGPDQLVLRASKKSSTYLLPSTSPITNTANRRAWPCGSALATACLASGSTPLMELAVESATGHGGGRLNHNVAFGENMHQRGELASSEGTLAATISSSFARPPAGLQSTPAPIWPSSGALHWPQSQNLEVGRGGSLIEKLQPKGDRHHPQG